jgi:hypothetical protein
MRKSRNALFAIMSLTCLLGPIMAVPTGAAELYIPSVHKGTPGHLVSYPYGGTYLRVDLAKRRQGYPYVGFYYGSYYAPTYAYSHAPAYWNYYDPFYRDYYGGYRSGRYLSRRCPRTL